MKELLAILHATCNSAEEATIVFNRLEAELAAVRAGTLPIVTIRDCCGEKSGPALPYWMQRKASRRSAQHLEMVHTAIERGNVVHCETRLYANPGRSDPRGHQLPH